MSIKLETANPVRSFKAPGTEVLAGRLADSGPRAVACASAGNLGQALAWSGRRRGLEVTVAAPRLAPAAKLDRIRALEARLELAEAAGSSDAALIALGGGAPAAGVGHVLKDPAPGAEVICVQPAGAPAMTLSWRRRRVVTTGPAGTIADGVAGRHPVPAVLDDLLPAADDAVPVSGAPVTAGTRTLPDHAGLAAEPPAAPGTAAIPEDRDRFAGRHAVTIARRSNADMDAYRRWTGTAPVRRS